MVEAKNGATGLEQKVRGPLLVPRLNGRVEYFADGLLVGDADGQIVYVGEAAGYVAEGGKLDEGVRYVGGNAGGGGLMMPPMVDIHTHIAQWPIRGRFVEGVPEDVPEGRLIAGLNRNVFPMEIRCDEEAVAEEVVTNFMRDTLAHGVVGGATYMTTSARAARVALSILPSTWQIGLVLMDQQCPEAIHTRPGELDQDMAALVADFGERVIVTDRFAVAVSTKLRKQAVQLAKRFGLRTQTHLNEQVAEKQFVEEVLYPEAASYTDVYLQDGLLDHRCIVAHCIQMRDEEWQILADTGSVVAHCPTSNVLLGSGVMPLDEVKRWGLDYAIATDVGASPTVSMLAEMRRFLTVHEGQSDAATACEALVRSTAVPAELLGFSQEIGCLSFGKPLSFIEVAFEDEKFDVGANADTHVGASAEQVIEAVLPSVSEMDEPKRGVERVTLAGRCVYERGED